jgi:AraC-like DNA-binding protein
LQANDLFLLTPGELSSYRADPLDPWEYCWVGFNGTDARRLVTMAGFSPDKPILRSRNPAETKRMLMAIAEVSGSSAADDAQMVGCLYLFLAHLIRLNGQNAVGNPHQEYVANALRFIQYNYANDIGISDIARYVGISRSQLYRAFLEDFGISPHTYLQRYRINEACSLLRNLNYSLAEVAGSVGFNDPLYFSRVFKTIKQCPPSVYQREIKTK